MSGWCIWCFLDTHFLFRFVITSWFLSALIASTAYGGNLRAFLMTPEKEKPIDDLAGLAQSGLTWNMVLYGETVERDMERSQVSKKPN